jgi:hypothetical protein
MSYKAISKIAYEIKELEKWCAENSYLTFDEMKNRIQGKVDEIITYAEVNNLPIKIDIDTIVEKHCSSDEYEDESSYYYEEEDSSYYEEDEDDDEEDDEEDSWY